MLVYFILVFLKTLVVRKAVLLVLQGKSILGFKMEISFGVALNMKFVPRNFKDYQTHYPPPEFHVEL